MGKSNDWFSLSELVEDIRYTTLSRIIYQIYGTYIKYMVQLHKVKRRNDIKQLNCLFSYEKISLF